MRKPRSQLWSRRRSEAKPQQSPNTASRPLSSFRFEDRSDALYLSSITAAEIETGISEAHRTGPPRRADELRAWFERMLSFYADRVLPFDLTAARIAGALSDAASAKGRHPGFADVAIAAIAKSPELVILTLNLRHFDHLAVETLNPLHAF